MKPTDVQRMLTQIPLPELVPGKHQQRLRRELMDDAQSFSSESDMNRFKSVVASRRLRAVASGLVVVVLVASGWAAEKVYDTVKQYQAAKRYHATEPILQQELPALDGEGTWTSSIVTRATADTPEMAMAKFKQETETVRKAIAEKEYSLLDTHETTDGLTVYLYQFELPDGSTVTRDFALPLEQVSSWEEYVEKLKEHEQRRHEEIRKAVSLGQFRLLDIDILRTHLCRERDSGQKIDVLCIVLPDATRKALVSTHPAHEAESRYDTDWQDHLAAIRSGDRELLDVQIVRSYKYEATLADGSKTIFSYGSNSPPLKKPTD